MNIIRCKFNKKKIALLIIFFNVIFLTSFGQGGGEDELQGIDPIVNNIIPSSPEAATFDKYVDVPVSYYTGVPDISIPIGELKGKYFSIPVSLSYHATGIKVEETAGWVGLGWALNVTGAITRNKRGLADEEANGFFESENLLPDPNYLYSAFSNWSPDFFEKMNIVNGHTDVQPDEFSFNFMGHSGKFYIYKESVYSIPRQNLKIEVGSREQIFYNGDSFYAITNFTVTTDDGIIYTFGKNPNGTIGYEITSSLNESSDITTNYISSWYLTSIYAHGNLINFNYDSRTEHMDDRYSQTASYFKTKTCISSTHPTTDDISPPIKITTEISIPKLVSVVNDSSGRIDFISTSEREDGDGSQLNEISFKNSKGVELKSFTFNYGYYNQTSNKPIKKRLKLLSVTENSNDKAKNKTYFFGYNNNPLPSRDSKDKDYWGYYNAKNNTTILPEFYDPTHNRIHPGADKTANPDVQLNGILEKIIYPTGGYVKFEYEPNDYGYFNYQAVEKPVTGDYSFSHSVGCTETGCDETRERSFLINSAKNQTVKVSAVFEKGNSDPMDIVVNLNGQHIFNGFTDIYLKEGDNWLTVHTGPWNKASVNFNYVSALGYTQKIPSSGLRIKNIKHYDKNSDVPVLTKQYYYTVANQSNRSSGVLLGRYPQCYKISKKAIMNGGLPGPGFSQLSLLGYYYYYTVNSDNIFEVSYSQGKHIVYKEVKEKVISDDETGYTVYKYNIASDEGTYVFPYTPVISNDWKRGLLLEKLIYDASNNLKMTEKNEYQFHYGSYNPYVNIIPGACVGIVAQGTYINEVETAVSIYNYKTEWYNLDKKITKVYLGENRDSVIDTVVYNYNNPEHMQISEQIDIKPDHKKLHTKYTYPADYSFNNCDDIYNTKKNEFDTLVQDAIDAYYQCKDVNEAACWDAYYVCISENDTTFCNLILADCNAESNCYSSFNASIPSTSYYIQPFENCLFLSAADKSADVQAVINMRLKGLHPNVIEKSVWKQNNNGLLELTSGNINKYEQVRTNLFLPDEIYTTDNSSPISENNFTYSTTASGNFVTDNSYTKKGNIRYSINGNVIEYTKQNDKPVTIIWGYYENYPIAKIENANRTETSSELDSISSSFDDIKSKSLLSDDETELINLFNLLRNKMPDVLITSYTYDPQIGITSITDPNGKTTWYNYDSFNRLSVVKDQDNNIIQYTEYNFHNYAYPVPSETNLGLFGGDFEFDIYAQGDWTIIEKSDWITLSQNSGTDNTQITGTCGSTDNERSSIIKIQCGDEVNEFSLSQNRYITVNPGGLSFMNSTSETQNIFVYCTSGYNWELSSDASWITFTPNSSSGNKEISVRCTQLNPIYDPRSADVNVTLRNTAGHIIEQESFSVSQDGAELPPGISGHVYDKWGFPMENVEVIVNEQPTDTTNSSGFYFFEIPGGGEVDFTVYYENHLFTPEHYFYSSPTENITDQDFYSNMEIEPLNLSVYPQLLYFSQGRNLNESLLVNCNADWTLTTSNPWISISDYHGLKLITVNQATNESREGKVTVRISGSNYTLDIPVIQEGTCTGDCPEGCSWDPLDCRCEDENGEPTCTE